MTRVAVVGHVEWVDFIPIKRFPRQGEVVHADGAFARAAGGGGVASVVLAELGAEVDFFLALGRDALGEAAAAELADRDVRVHVAWREQPTRRALTLLEQGAERTIVTMGERLQPEGADDLDWDVLASVDGVYFTAGDAGAVQQARRAPVLVASPRGRSGLEAPGCEIDALVFSLRDADEHAWADRLADRTRLLVATDGANGGRWWGASEGTWAAAPVPGEPRDSYGCGDSFAAGFTLGLAAGRSVGDAAAVGAQAGARALARTGAP